MGQSDFRKVVRASRLAKEAENARERMTALLKRLTKDEIITVVQRTTYFRHEQVLSLCYELLIDRNKRKTHSVLAELYALPQHGKRSAKEQDQWWKLHKMCGRLMCEFERLMDEAYPETKN